MGRRARSLRAAALVNRDVHQHAAGPHPPQHFAVDQLRRFGARHQHRADEQVHRRQQFHQMRLARIKRVRRVQRDVEETHPLQIHFQNRHVRAESLRHARGVDARRAAAEHDDFSRQHARHAAEQHAAAAKMFRQKITARPESTCARRFRSSVPATAAGGSLRSFHRRCAVTPDFISASVSERLAAR